MMVPNDEHIFRGVKHRNHPDTIGFTPWQSKTCFPFWQVTGARAQKVDYWAVVRWVIFLGGVVMADS